MVLSQRHRILRHYMEKAVGRRGKTLHGEDEEEMSVSGEGVEGTDVSSEGVEVTDVGGGGVDGGSVGGECGESEAEEVIVCYGEEDEELLDSQSIGEPWDWTEGRGEQEDQEIGHDMMAEEVKAADQHSCERQTLEADIVSPSLLVS